MNKLKIIAKSHMLSKTAPIFLTFLMCVSVLVFFGDFSLFVSYALNAFGLETLISQSSQALIVSVSAVIGLASVVLLCAPLRLGRERWFMLNAKGETPKFKDLFYYFSPLRYTKALCAWIYSGIMKIGAASVFFFPSLCLSLVLAYCLSSQSTPLTLTVCLAVGDIILLSVGTAFMFVYNGGFLLYYPIIVSNETIKSEQAYAYSKTMTTPVLAKLALFRLSFAPWWSLCVLLIPTFYVWGYYKQTMSELAYRNEHLH